MGTESVPEPSENLHILTWMSDQRTFCWIPSTRKLRDLYDKHCHKI